MAARARHPLADPRRRGQPYAVRRSSEPYAQLVALDPAVAVNADSDGVVLFGGARDPLSNFAVCGLAVACPFCAQRLTARTVEHAFQASKATGCEDFHRLMEIVSPSQARKAGRQVALRGDWDAAHPTSGLSVKATVMLDLLHHKYAIERFRGLLLATGQQVLIENAPWDGYWGAGRDGRGRNALGRLLMRVREEIRLNRRGLPTPAPTPPVMR